MAALLLAAVGAEARQAAEPRTAAGSREGDFLSRVRRLTVEGRRAGEGYWSPDGQRLVFQSEREAGQSFLSDLRARPDDGRHKANLSGLREDDLLVLPSRHRRDSVSPRHTTIRKSKALQQEELDFRASGKERRYSWDYDPEFEIYAFARERSAQTTRADERARLRRGGQLFARRSVDRVLVDARRVQRGR